MLDETYEQKKGEWGLLNPVPVELDETIRRLAQSYASKSEDERTNIRAAVTLEEYYILFGFARRCSVFALRDSDPGVLMDGLTALAMLENERADFRDILVAIALLHYTATRLNVDRASAFEAAADLAGPEVAELIRSFLARDEKSKDLSISWGFREVNIESGIGFASSGFKKYDPGYDLMGHAIRLARIIDEDFYTVNRIEIATDLPKFWLSGIDDITLDATLAGMTAGVTVGACLDESKHPEAGYQMFVLFTVELDTAEAAQWLLEISEIKRSGNVSVLGFAKENVFTLIVAQSTLHGGESFEKGDSLDRFLKPIGNAMQLIQKAP